MIGVWYTDYIPISTQLQAPCRKVYFTVVGWYYSIDMEHRDVPLNTDTVNQLLHSQSYEYFTTYGSIEKGKPKYVTLEPVYVYNLFGFQARHKLVMMWLMHQVPTPITFR